MDASSFLLLLSFWTWFRIYAIVRRDPESSSGWQATSSGWQATSSGWQATSSDNRLDILV